MKTINILFVGALAAANAAANAAAHPASASDIQKSGRTEIFDNPFIATGFNPQTRVLTGYVQGLRTEPGRTDACQFVFSGKVDKPESIAIVITEVPAGAAKPDATGYRGSISSSAKQQALILDPKQLPGDCEWVLPSIGEPKVLESGKNLSVPIETSETGAWIGVSVIGAKRAYLHKQPVAASVGKAFLVSGDVVYVVEDKADWLHVKYRGKKKETVGWIEKAATLQP